MSLKKIGLTALVAVMSALITVVAYNYLGGKNTAVSFEEKQAAHFASVNYAAEVNAAGPVNFRSTARITTPAVVHIKVGYAPRNTSSSRREYNNPFRDFFGQGDPFDPFGQMQPAQPEESSGSGVIISDDGYIVTNNHVVENGDKIQVILYDKRTYDGKVIGTDQATDLALVKIDEKDLPFIRFGNSDSVEVGDWVLAVGNPFNLESTVTAGIVSAKGRNIGIIHPADDKGNVSSAIESYIQTDAAVNPGNSGGALVNTSGELIGINSAIATPTGSFAGYSFAVPVNIVKKVVDDLVKFGMVQRGYLGITIRSVDADLAKKEGLNELKGVYVDSIYKGSAAAEAGLKIGDVITSINGVEVNSSPELQEQVSEFHPGDKISVNYLRDNKSYTASATLKNKEGDVSFEAKPTTTDIDQLGAEFSDLSAKDKKDMGVDGGVKVTKINDGKLSQTEIREGFIITNINNQPVKNVDDLKRLLTSNSRGNGVLIEGRYPGDPTVYYYAIGM